MNVNTDEFESIQLDQQQDEEDMDAEMGNSD